MIPVGERLRHEREARNTSLEQLSEATGIGLVYLQAMERDDHDALPGRAFGKLYVRAYAEILGFDPKPLIDQYDREQRFRAKAPSDAPRAEPAGARPVAAAIARWRENKEPPRDRSTPVETTFAAPEAAPAVEAGEDETVASADEPQKEPLRPAIAEEVPSARWAGHRVTAISLVLLATVATLYVVRRAGGSSEPSRRAEPTLTVDRPVSPPPAAPPTPAPPAIRAPAAPRPLPSPPGSLSVPEFGIGRRIAGRLLEGESTEFAPGEVACFQTRVLGGRAGDTVRHVWIHEGRAQQSIALRVGGPDWRTYSTKTVLASGSWTVEARDRDGRVLATARFSVGMIPPRVGEHR